MLECLCEICLLRYPGGDSTRHPEEEEVVPTGVSAVTGPRYIEARTMTAILWADAGVCKKELGSRVPVKDL